jgi:hypothetical protein
VHVERARRAIIRPDEKLNDVPARAGREHVALIGHSDREIEP